MKADPKAYEWDWDGACAPGFGKDAHAAYNTFSVGIFQWLPKTGGKGLKRGKVLHRVKGRTHSPKVVFDAAEEIVAWLNHGGELPDGSKQ